jgi:hypothetical protein
VPADAGEEATQMWRDRNRYDDHGLVPDTFWLLVAAVLFAACGLVWLVGQVAAIVFGAHEHLPVRLVDMLGVLLRLPGTWDDPAQAWPSSSQPLLPGPVGMYAAAVLTVPASAPPRHCRLPIRAAFGGPVQAEAVEARLLSTIPGHLNSGPRARQVT